MSYATEHQNPVQITDTGLLFHVNLSPAGKKASKISEHRLFGLASTSKYGAPVMLHSRK